MYREPSIRNVVSKQRTRWLRHGPKLENETVVREVLICVILTGRRDMDRPLIKCMYRNKKYNHVITLLA